MGSPFEGGVRGAGVGEQDRRSAPGFEYQIESGKNDIVNNHNVD
jgi:hypothetical protein